MGVAVLISLALWGRSVFVTFESTTATEIVATPLSCARPFKPEDVLEALQQRNAIGLKPTYVIDGIPVFRATRPFSAYGLVVRFVEGWDTEGKLFFHAPGMSPPRHIAITVNGSKEYVESLIRQRVPESGLTRYLDDHPNAYAVAAQEVLTAVVCVLPNAPRG